MSVKKPKTVFFHLPKTGGTSLHRALCRTFDKDSIFPERFNKFHEYTPAELNDYRFFSGHYTWHGISMIPNPTTLVTILREPGARIMSLYYFWRSHRWEIIDGHDLVGPRIAKENGLLDFLKDRSLETHGDIDNTVTRLLCGAGKGDDLTEADYERALANLLKFDQIGFLEAMDRSTGMIFDRLGRQAPEETPHALSSEAFASTDYPMLEKIPREPITGDISDELERLTRWDSRLYAFSLAAFWPRTPCNRRILLRHEGGRIPAYGTYGWRAPGRAGMWMNARTARLDLRTTRSVSRVRMNLDLNPGLKPDGPCSLRISSGGTELGHLDMVDGRLSYDIGIDCGNVVSGKLGDIDLTLDLEGEFTIDKPAPQTFFRLNHFTLDSD